MSAIVGLMKDLGVAFEHNQKCMDFIQGIPPYAPQYLEYHPMTGNRMDFLYGVNTTNDIAQFPLSSNHRFIVRKLLSMYEAIPYFWFEYDRLSVNSKSGIHVCVKPGYLGSAQTAKQYGVNDFLGMLSILSECKITIGPSFTELLEIIQVHGELIHLSYMASRVPPCIKLYVKVRRSDVFNLLNRLGWGGDPIALTKLLNSEWLESEDNEIINLDLKWIEGLTPYIGIVFSDIRIENGSRDIRRLTSIIESNVICQDQEIEAILSWLVSKPLHAALNSSVNRPVARPLKWLDIKTVLNEDSNVFSKLYFGYQDKTAKRSTSCASSIEADHVVE